MKKVLIIGIDSFTGVHLASYLKKDNYDVYGTTLSKSTNKKYKCDITQKENISEVLNIVKPDYLIHLSGVSFAAHGNNEDFYKINTIGTINILETLLSLKQKPKKIILASSATVYGNQGLEVLDESLCPKPANHYGASKYSMECLASGYFDKLSIIITRPFNYTGQGQAEHFLVPKIVKHFKEKKDFIELGNLDVIREFNDIDFVCESYKKLLECKASEEIVNICSGRGIKLLDIIALLKKITNHNIEIRVNQEFVRKDEIKSLTGSPFKLFNLIGEVKQFNFEETLLKMLDK
ncbi:epimerase [Halarcobacter mediterraneus]|uniref:Epimerase n=1 Tax=Halarcobacter mediterraneus TaxID=2023153 RepID=A0A4Q1B302_9BACT|nr:NAD-dependent epimerase/dehydratase family protein [Halarcobacter mediterraneus]RXK12299.1 epimerase [Halarcobacter mediterraneus]